MISGRLRRLRLRRGLGGFLRALLDCIVLMVMGGSRLQHVELRAEIERLGAAHGPARPARRERASDASWRARRRAALALAHGRVREPELERRVGRG